MDRLEEANLAVGNFLDDDDDDVEMNNDDNVTSEGMKRLEKLYKRFEAYCKELVVFGFNSAGYDIKLIKKLLFKELCEHVNNQILLSRNLESIPVSRQNT